MKRLVRLFPFFFSKEKRQLAGMWTTKEGKHLHITKMHDHHLVNTFNYIIKVARANHQNMLSSVNVFAGILSGEITPESLDHMAYGDPEKEAMQQPIMLLMLEELYKRGLENSYTYAVSYLMPPTFEEAMEELKNEY